MKALGVNNNYLKGLNMCIMLIIKKELSLEVLLKHKFIYYLHYLYILHFVIYIS